MGTGERDRLTGYALDEQGGYRVPMVVDGIAYAPRFHSCGSRECAGLGVNIDFSDPATLTWIRTVDAKTADQVSFLLGAAAVVAPAGMVGGLSYGATGLGILSNYLKEDVSKGVSSSLLGEALVKYATTRGLSADQATRLSSAIGTADGWSAIIESARE